MEPAPLLTFVISIIGAAAWIPQLIATIVGFMKKPLITISPVNHTDIGFTELGPIINVKVAITSDNADTVIDLIELEVKHESGSTHKFKWHEVTEVKGQIIVSGSSNESISQLLESEATAIKVLQTDLKEVFLRNRLDAHTSLNRKYGNEFNKERRRLINNNQYTPEAFYVTKIVQDLQAFLQSQMVWKKGRYTIQFHLSTRNKATVICPKFSFELSDDDIVLLQSNCDNMPKLVRNACYAGFSEIEAGVVPLEWHWLDKDLIKI